MQCPQCGAENTEFATFCGLCLNRFEVMAPSVVEATTVESPPVQAEPESPNGLASGRAARAQIVDAERHMHARDPSAAEPLLRAAISGYADGGIDRGIELEVALNNLGGVLDDLGKPGEAAEFYQRCVGLVEQRMGANSPTLVAHLDNLGNVLLNAERWGEAATVFDRAVTLGSERRSAIYSGIKKAEALMQLNRLGECEAAIVAADTIAVSEYGERGEPRCPVLNQWHRLWRRQGKIAEAEHVLRLAIDIELKAPKRDTAIYGMLVDNLDKLLAETGSTRS